MWNCNSKRYTHPYIHSCTIHNSQMWKQLKCPSSDEWIKKMYYIHIMKCYSANSTWTVNFQMFKLKLEKAEEPEIKLPTSAGSSKKQDSSRKTSISALMTMEKPLTVWITKKNWKILKEMGIPDHLTCLLRNLYAGQEATARSGLVPNQERNTSRLYIVTLLS